MNTHLRFWTAFALLAGAVAFFAFRHGQLPPTAQVAETPSTSQKLEEVKEVRGKPVTTVRMPEQQPAKAVAGEVVTKVSDPAAVAALGEARPAGPPNTYLVTVDRSKDMAAEVARIQAIPGVTNAGPNYVAVALVVPNDSFYGDFQWNLPKVSAPQAWDRTVGDADTVIASLDTGVNYNHQDLAAKMWNNTAETAGNSVDDDLNGYVDDYRGMDFVNANFVGGKYVSDADGAMDDDGHGTFTSSIAAAATNNNLGVAGVNWLAKVMPVKVLDSNGVGTFVDVANGIRYAASNGAQVINMSLGAQGVTSDFNTDDAIAFANGRGVSMVAASGNDGNPNLISYPAYNGTTISVGATTSTDSVAGYSNGGPNLTVTAPGSNIAGAGLANNGYVTGNGTSLAAPHVAGQAALVKAIRPQAAGAEVKQLIAATADKPSGMGGVSRTNGYGFGRINIDRTLAQMPQWSAQWVGQSAQPTVGSGEQVSVYFDFRNTGANNWSSTGPNPVRLGTSNPLDRGSGFQSDSWISPNRPATFSGRVENGSVVPTNTIAPGEVARFQFTLTGPPTTAANHRDYFRPVVEGIGWLEDQGVYQEVILPARSYAYAYAGQTNPPAVMQPGQTAMVSLDLTNTGTATWRRTDRFKYRMGTSNPLDRLSGAASGWPTPNRLPDFAGKVSGGTVTDSDTIAPGETARFSFDFKASGAGLRREYFRPVLEGWAWQQDIGIYFETFVPDLSPSVPEYQYQWVGQSAYPILQRDEQRVLKLQVRNTGRATWNSSGPNPVRLGTLRPTDRGSGFSNNGTAPGWTSPNRIKLTRNLTDASKNVVGETTVAPGEVGEYEFTVVGTPPSGTYYEFFAPIAEGITWMRDIGLYWGITVQSPIKVGLTNQTSVAMRSSGTVTLRAEGGGVIGTVGANQQFGLTYNGQYVVNLPGGGVLNSGAPVRAEQPVDAVMTVDNIADNGAYNRFRGVLYVKNGSPGAWLVNEVDLELYLRGMGEVPDSWPMEAIKAQTVAARTFAARKMQAPRNEVFAIYDTVSDQVYNGYNSEVAKPNHTPASESTRGLVVRYGSDLAQTYYSSDTGGATENNENVWGGSAIPYLRGVSDPYEKPDTWAKTVSNATLQANYGHPGNIDAINITSFYPSGRVRTMQLVTNGGPVTNHTLLADTHRSRMTTRSSRVTGLTRSGNDWVIQGRGFGHGIGMGQWGAYNQAAAGRNFAQILTFYYTGTSISSLY